MKVKPISPDEIVKQKLDDIPPFVFTFVNKRLAAAYVEGFAVRVYQKDIIQDILNHKPNLEPSDVVGKGWLNFEACYEKAGWKVRYCKPAYNESWDSYFEFKKRSLEAW